MKKVSILFISNSFGDDTIQYMPEIAKDFDYDLDLYNLFIGGCDINTHIENIKKHNSIYELRIYDKNSQTWNTKYDVSINDFAKSKNWDYIILQQSSYYSGLTNGLDNIDVLLKLVKELVNKDAKFIWNMTWSYPKYSDLEVFIKEFNSDQDKMHQAIINNVKKDIQANKTFSKIIPNGIAIYLARKALGDELIHRDGFHLSYQPGRYLAGLTAVMTILDVDIRKTKYYPHENMDILKRDILIDIAFKACKTNI